MKRARGHAADPGTAAMAKRFRQALLTPDPKAASPAGNRDRHALPASEFAADATLALGELAADAVQGPAIPRPEDRLHALAAVSRDALPGDAKMVEPVEKPQARTNSRDALPREAKTAEPVENPQARTNSRDADPRDAKIAEPVGGSQTRTNSRDAVPRDAEPVGGADCAIGRMGVIVHWGLYSVPAFDTVASARRRSIQNGSEWYLQRLRMSETSYHPTSGWRETQAYHRKHYGEAPYEAFARQFTAASWQNLNVVSPQNASKEAESEPDRWMRQNRNVVSPRNASKEAESEPDRWMRQFRDAGASYVILTAKHHDGFCLWPTKTTAHNSLKSGPRLDLLGLFRDAARRHGLAFGIYYSWSEFQANCTKIYLDRVVAPQIDELIAYAPDLFWFDGDWMCTTVYAQTVMDAACAKIRRQLPHVQINDRVGHRKERQAASAAAGPWSTYRVYADRALPASKPSMPWEHVNTIGLSWGRNAQQSDADYKSGADLRTLRDRVWALGGRFLINVGPNADGTLCSQETQRLALLSS
jgi:alpha-L-fucosidase